MRDQRDQREKHEETLKISAWVGAVPRKEVVCSAWQMLGMLGVVLGISTGFSACGRV